MFLGKLLPKPKLYTKFEVVSFNGFPLAQTPLILALKVVCGKLLPDGVPVPKLYKKNLVTGTVCFEEKTAICNTNFGIKYVVVVESAIFGIADPDLLIHYATFMGLQ